MRAICGALNVETQLMAAQMKQKSFRGTGGSHNPDHKSSDAGRSVFEYSDDETDIESDSDNDSDNDDDSNIWFTSFAADVLLYTTCLTQLGNALECPAPEAEQPQSTPVKSEKAVHACSICGKTFSRYFQRRNHEVVHRGPRPHECPECGKAFTRLNDCKRHQNIHERR